MGVRLVTGWIIWKCDTAPAFICCVVNSVHAVLEISPILRCHHMNESATSHRSNPQYTVFMHSVPLWISSAHQFHFSSFFHYFSCVLRFRFRFISIVARRLKITENETQFTTSKAKKQWSKMQQITGWYNAIVQSTTMQASVLVQPI